MKCFEYNQLVDGSDYFFKCDAFIFSDANRSGNAGNKCIFFVQVKICRFCLKQIHQIDKKNGIFILNIQSFTQDLHKMFPTLKNPAILNMKDDLSEYLSPLSPFLDLLFLPVPSFKNFGAFVWPHY